MDKIVVVLSKSDTTPKHSVRYDNENREEAITSQYIKKLGIVGRIPNKIRVTVEEVVE